MRETAPPSAVSGKPPRRGQDPARATNLHEAPVWHCCLGQFSGGSARVGGGNNNSGRKTGPSVTSAVRPRLNSRESWSLGRKKRRRARNALPKRRLGRVASDFCPVVVSHSGGLQISGGHVIERPCHLGEVAMVIVPAELTTHDERTRHGRKICKKHQFGILV